MYTQKDVAEHLNMSDRQVRKLIKRGVLPDSKRHKGYDLDESRLAYISYLRSLAKQGIVEDELDPDGEKSGEEELNYSRERTLNIREQKRARKIQNELALKTLLPVDVVIEMFGAIVAASRSKILAVESKAAIAMPELTKKQQRTFKELLHDALRDLANEPLPPSLTEYLENHSFDLDAAAKSDD